MSGEGILQDKSQMGIIGLDVQFLSQDRAEGAGSKAELFPTSRGSAIITLQKKGRGSHSMKPSTAIGLFQYLEDSSKIKSTTIPKPRL
jgi:hypothetical protein